jgi:hypothetical protein
MPHTRLHRTSPFAYVGLLGGVFFSSFACATTPPEDDGPFTAGSRVISVAGIAGGNASVALRVHYPATAAGASQPLLTSGAPYPVIVFGHGFSLQVSLYDTLLRHLATHGFIAAGVATEEGLFTGNLPRYLKDCQAAVIGLRAAGSSPASPFFQGISPDARAGIAGHSFGGAAAIVAASQRPDLFSALVTLAATATSPQGVDILAATAALAVPACHIGASFDSIVPPASNLDPIYAATPTTKRLLEIANGNHGYFHEAFGLDWLTEAPAPIGVAEQQRIVRRYQLSFFRHFVAGVPDSLSDWMGPSAVADPALSRQSVDLKETLLFGAGSGAPSSFYGLYPARRPGDSASIFVASALAPQPIATPYGPFRLDPGSAFVLFSGSIGPNGYLAFEFVMPALPALSGLQIPVQAIAPLAPGNSLSNVWSISIP